DQCIDHVQIILCVANDQRAAVWPERRACAPWERDAHALQHCLRICAADQLAVIIQGLSRGGSALQLIHCTRSACAGPHSGSGLKTYCLFLNLLLSDRRHLRISTLSALATGYLASNIVAHVQRTAEKLRRYVISFRDQIVALFGKGNDRYGVRFYFDF